MLAYLILAGRDGRPVQPEFLHRFERDVPDAVPFVPEARIVWKNRDSSVVFLGWQAFTDFAGIGSHWVVEEHGLTAFTGHCWPQATGWDHRSGRNWAVQLRDELRNHRNALEARPTLYGHFSLVLLSTAGEGQILPDYLNAEQVFVAEADGVTAVSNRAGLCARAIVPPGSEPVRSLTGAGWLLCNGWICDEESGYWDVDHIPFGSHIALDPLHGATIVEPSRSPLIPTTGAVTYEEVLDQVDGHLRASVRAIANLPVSDIEFALSGGKDSRLLLAIILSEGLRDRFTFVTAGPPDKADPIVARQLAERFGLQWSLIDRTGRPPAQEEDEVRSHTSLVEGLVSAWDTVGPTAFVPGAVVNGVAGEYLRFGRMGLLGTGVSSEAELLAHLQRRTHLDPLQVLRPEVRDYYVQHLNAWARWHLARGEDLQRVTGFLLAETLVRSRFGPVRSWSARMSLSPYVTATVVQANHRLPMDELSSLRMQIDLMRRSSIALSKLPFAEKSWDPANYRHLPDAEDYHQIVPVYSATKTAQNWRLTGYDRYRPMLETYLLDRENPIAELIDRQRLVDRIASGNANAGRTRRLWDALTAAIWMGRHDLPVKITR